MSSSSNRNPKVLKDLIQQTSHLEMDCSTSNVEQIEESMKNLRNLSNEEKTEIGLLKSRIEEQSRLIMILKQRGDDFINKNMILDKLNQELIEKKDQLEKELTLASTQLTSLQEKFNYLGDTQQELIKIKDEYKDKEAELTKENQLLLYKLKNSRAFDEINEEKQRMNEIMKLSEFKIRQIGGKCVELENELVKWKNYANERDIELQVTGKEIEAYRVNTDELKKTNRDLVESLEKLKLNLVETNEKHAKEVEALQKEKHELLLACDSLKKEKSFLSESYANVDKNYKAIFNELNKYKEKFTKESLHDKLLEAGLKYQNLEKEFEAYKKHANYLIDREKELNNKLRFMIN